MAPFPETETMTLKRIEVSIKKRDWALLNDGLLKIQEKLTTNHKWEFFRQWRELLSMAEEQNLPPELFASFSSAIRNILSSDNDDDVVIIPSLDEISREESIQIEEEPVEQSSPAEEIELSLETEEPQPQQPQQQQQQLPLAEEKPEPVPVFVEPVVNVAPQEQTLKQEVEPELKMRDYSMIFYNEDIDETDAELISAYRNELNNMITKNKNFVTDKSWLENTTYLVNSLNKTNTQMNEFLFALKDVKVQGTIVSSGYSSSVMQTLIKSGINFEMPVFREPRNSENYFKYIALGGLINSYICSNCGHKMLKTEFRFDAVLGCCKKCSSILYPDIYDITNLNASSLPKSWYQAFKEMASAPVWVLVNPPVSAKPQVEEFLSFVGSNAKAKRVYIVSKNIENSNFWKNLLQNKMPQADIKNHYPNMAVFLSEFREFEIKSY
jgi:hypothetical protein